MAFDVRVKTGTSNGGMHHDTETLGVEVRLCMTREQIDASQHNLRYTCKKICKADISSDTSIASMVQTENSAPFGLIEAER